MEFTERGFATAEGFDSEYHGQVTVRESSNAMGPYLWIFADKTPYSTSETGQGSAVTLQLSLEEAKMLRYDLDKMIGYLKDTWHTNLEE